MNMRNHFNNRRKSLPVIQTSPVIHRRQGSLTSGLQNIFKKKQFHSHVNFDDDLLLHCLTSSADGMVFSTVTNESPRIWKVRHRNSVSESLVDNLALVPLQEDPVNEGHSRRSSHKHFTTVLSRNVNNFLTCTDRYDIIGCFKDFVMYEYVNNSSNPEGRNLVLKRYGGTSACRHRYSVDVGGRCDVNGACRSRDGKSGDLRWSGAENRSTFCHHSVETPEISVTNSRMSSRSNSINNVDLDTSYWDLHIPDSDLYNTSRRHSWSPDVATFPKSGQPTRGFTNISSIHARHFERRQCTSISYSDHVYSKAYTPSSPGGINCTLPTQRRKRSRSETNGRFVTDEHKLLQRSRSADCSQRGRQLRRSKRVSSLVCHIPFSDIEASDDSDKEQERSHESSSTYSSRNSQSSRGVSSSVDLHNSSSEGEGTRNKKNDKCNYGTEKNETIEDADGGTFESSTISKAVTQKIDEEHADKIDNLEKKEIGKIEEIHVENQELEEIGAIEDRQDSTSLGLKTPRSLTPENDGSRVKLIDDPEKNKSEESTEMLDENKSRKESKTNEDIIDSRTENLKTTNNLSWRTDEETADETHKTTDSFETLEDKKQSEESRTSANESITEDNYKSENNLEFKSMSLEDLLFCSGRRKVSESEQDDVEDVFDAIHKEAEKIENTDKDMMVMFLVGGELKVLRRSGATGHGDRIRSDIPSMTRQDVPHYNGNHDQVVHSRHPTSDQKRPRPKSEIIIGRSQSFAGMAESSPQKKAAPGAMVLGESFRHHRGGTMPVQKSTPVGKGATGVSFRKSPKVPKVPRPNRALLMFQSVKNGIREFIDATKEDIEDLQSRDMDVASTAQGRLHETDKQLKSAERYLKRLEFHLSKLDELHEYYMVQQQLREGVRTMHKAYVTSPGNQRNTLSSVKYGYKECTLTMCNIEAQLEAMMGTFNCKLKGIAGFARLCPGDVFEVTTRHGTQKWKTKGRIEKTGNQKWDIPEYNFKAVVGDIIHIKGVEVRAFKSILLGQKSCETKDLFSANPQLMTVSINVNGSLKLSIVITWNPLDGVDENVVYVETPMRPQGTPRRRPVSVIAINGQHVDQGQFEYERRHSNPASMQQTRDNNFILRSNMSTPQRNNLSSYHGLDSPHVGSRTGAQLPEAYHYTQLGPLHSQSVGNIPGGYSSSPTLYRETDSSFNQNSVLSSSLPPVMSHLHFPSVSLRDRDRSHDTDSAVSNIEDVIHNLSSALEDYHGQYAELNKLEELVKFAQKLLRKQLRNSSRSSSISVSIEDALEAFDFLDTEEITEDPHSPAIDNNKSTFDDMLCSPESTAKTGDSGIESLAQRLSEDTQLGSSLGSSPLPPSLGNEEVDQCLMYHLTYCERLLENLGAFGPLKCREIYALDKLQKQSTIIESLLKQARSGSQFDLHSVMTTLCDNKNLREFWVKCTDQTSLYVSPDRLLTSLEQKFASVIAEKHAMDPLKVCQHVITRVLDVPDYESEQGRPYFVITLHQFMLYFNEEGGLKHVEDVASELKLVEKLTSGNSDMVIKAILTLRDSIPTAPCLKIIGMLLVTLDKEVEQCTISYLNLIQKKKENRDRAMIVFVEGLEDRTSEIRAGACAALAILEATESKDQLVYLWQSDSSQLVQNKAKEALLSMGEEGRKAFEEAQLSKHGFQGLQVQKSTF